MDEEVLDVGPRRQLPRGLIAVGAVVVAAGLVVAIGVRARHDDTPSAAPTSPSTSTSAPAPFPVLPKPSAPFDSNGTIREQLLSYVYTRAFDSTPASDTVLTDTNSSSCVQSAPDARPAQRIVDVLQQFSDRLTVRDVARTIDKFAGLCVVEVRASFDDGTALVTRVVAPVEDAQVIEPRTDQGTDVQNGLLVQFVRVTLRSGWGVTVGTTGPTVSGPSRAALAQLARDPALLW